MPTIEQRYRTNELGSESGRCDGSSHKGRRSDFLLCTVVLLAFSSLAATIWARRTTERLPNDIKVTGNLTTFGMTDPVKVNDRWMRFAFVHTIGSHHAVLITFPRPRRTGLLRLVVASY